MEIDHVLLVVGDIDGAAERLLREYGLGSVVGGEHPEWGTGNRIVPLGAQYLELFGIREPTIAAANPIGQWAAARGAAGDVIAAVAVATDDLDDVAARLGLEASAGSRALPDGSQVSWRMAGVEAAIAQQLPFFIEWDEPALAELPRLQEGVDTHGISWVELGGDPERASGWLDDDVPGLRLVGGAPGVRAIGIATGDGELMLPERLWM